MNTATGLKGIMNQRMSLNLTRCKIEYPNTEKVREVIDNISLDNYFCLDKNANFSLGGVWGASQQKILSYQIFWDRNNSDPQLGK